jgi:D-xylose transport system substrate-binding protein
MRKILIFSMIFVLCLTFFAAVVLVGEPKGKTAPGEAFEPSEKAPEVKKATKSYSPVKTYKHRIVPADEKVIIGFLLPDQRVERFVRDKDIFVPYAESIGAKVIWDSSDYDHATQTTQVENLLAQGVDVLVIHPVHGDVAGVFVEMAHAEGVPVIASDGVIKHPDIDFFVTQDSVKVGEVQAQAYIDIVGKEGKYVIIMGQPGHSVAKLITEGNHNILDKYSGMEMIQQTEHENWAPELSQKTAEDVLTREKDDVQAFFCNNSRMANGVLQAVIARGLEGEIFVAGSDADLTMVTNVLNYERVVDVIKWIAPLSMVGVDTAVALARGEYDKIKYHVDYAFEDPDGVVATIVTPVTAVTPENVKETVVDTNWIPGEKLGL